MSAMVTWLSFALHKRNARLVKTRPRAWDRDVLGLPNGIDSEKIYYRGNRSLLRGSYQGVVESRCFLDSGSEVRINGDRIVDS